jgi:hypothetical protein
MDRFRVRALENSLRLGLEPWQEALVRAELVKKCRILARGFDHRGNPAEAEKYRALSEAYATPAPKNRE